MRGGVLPLLLLGVAFGSEFGSSFRKHFWINASVTPLNHGAFGATPRAVLAAQTRYAERMESSCDAWFHEGIAEALVKDTRAEVARFVGSNVSNLVLVDNASAAANAALRSLRLGSEDVLLRLSWEYPMGVTVSDYVSRITGARVVVANMSFPTDVATIVSEVEAALRQHRPRVFFFDAIASYPAFVLPTEQLLALCRKYKVVSIVDGAHAIGQIPLNLEQLDADVYFSNGYKWLCSPKNSALMRVSPRLQGVVWPATINNGDANFATRFWWTGTRDFSAWFAMRDAIAFRRQHGGEAAWMAYNNGLCQRVFDALSRRWNVTRAVPAALTASLLTMPLPCGGPLNPRCPFPAYAIEAFMKRHNLQVVTLDFNGGKFVRFSCQTYNDFSEYVRFADLLDEFFAGHHW